jgi:PKD repeat protein
MNKKISLLLIFLCAFSMILPYVNVAKAQSGPSIYLDPSTVTATQLNEEFTLSIKISNVDHLWGWDANVTWDKDCIALVGEPKAGNFMSDQLGSVVFGVATPDDVEKKLPENKCNFAVASLDGPDSYASGSGVLATIKFKVIKPCSEALVVLDGISLVKKYDFALLKPAEYITPAAASSTTTVSLGASVGPPIASAGEDQTVNRGTQVTFNASKTVSVGENTTYTWTFNDGTAQTLTGMVTSYAFNNSGTYDVSLTVTDSLGTDTDSVTITVKQDTVNPDDITPPPPSNSNSNTYAGLPELPLTITGIIVVVTVFVLAGAVFWLRKRA